MYDNDTVLTDLLGVAHLQVLQDNFANLTGVFTVLVDPDGYPITDASRCIGLFAMLLKNKQGYAQRRKLIREMCVKNRRARTSVTLQAHNTQLLTGAVPIFLGDVHLGSWIIGPILQNEEDRGRLREFAQTLGLDAEDVQAGGAELPITSIRAFEDMFQFLEAMTQTVMQLAQASYDTMRSNQNLTELTEQLSSTAQMLVKFTNSADVGMYVTDFFTGEILQANNRYAEYVGVLVEDLVGTQCWRSHNRDWETFCPDCPHDRLLDDKGFPGRPVVWERYVEERQMWTQLTNQAIYWVDGRLAHMVTFVDITQTKRMQEELAYLAYYDRSMHLPNSLRLLQDLKEWDAARPCHLVCFDILSLRTINDVYSRQTGDNLLSAVAEWVQGKSDMGRLYRVDGDTFGLLLWDAPREQVPAVARKILERFEEPWIFHIGGQKLHLFCNITIGVVFLDRPPNAGEEDLLSRVDRILDTARDMGSLTVYDEEMDEQHKERLRLEMSLRTCVKEGMRGFEVCYQPIVDPVRGTWCSLEALCRWNSPECGAIAPLEFIHEAEQMGLIGIIGRWVLETAVSQCKAWGLDKLDYFLLDVNLSPAQMTDDMLAGSVIEILERHDYPCEKLSLEITESTELNFSNHTIGAIERLRKAGVQVALDDFGTGYSSFNNLKQLPVSILKTEKAFLDNIENDDYIQYLFYLLVELGHAAGMKLIAEGVENEEQMRILLKNGVDYLQGYLFSRPLSCDEMAGKLENFTRVSSVFYDMHSDRIDLQKLLHSGYTITPSLYQTLNQCMQQLLSPVGTEEPVRNALRIVGERFGVSRVCVFWNQGDNRFLNLHEWHAPGIQPVGDYYERLAYPQQSKSWMRILRKKGMLLSMDVTTLPKDLEELLAGIDTKAVAVLPIWRKNVLEGFVGFDDCTSCRDWLPEEILMLYNLCLLVASVLEKRSLEQELVRHNRALGNVLNRMDTYLYITDLTTNRVLFANDKVAERAGQVEGKICWEAVQGKDRPCDNCKKDWLVRNPDTPSCTWECTNPKNGRHYRVNDSIITWKDDKPAHMQYAMDITHLREYQEQLEMYAAYDVVTKTLNRGTLLTRLRGKVEEAVTTNHSLTICFVDVDSLKYINDNYGHARGDEALLATVDALQTVMGEEDIIGRYGGDEFVMALWGIEPEMATIKLEQALELLRSKRSKPYVLQFSYGVVGVSEVSTRLVNLAEKLLEVADGRMLGNKRSKNGVRLREEAVKSAGG